MKRAAVLILALCLLAATVSAEIRVYRSSDLAFTTTAPDLALAISITNHAQKIRSKIEKKFNTIISWDKPLLIELRSYENMVNGEAVEQWQLKMSQPGITRQVTDIYYNRLQQSIIDPLTFFCIAQIYGNYTPLPRWVYLGTAENLDHEHRQVFRTYIMNKILSEEVLPLSVLLEQMADMPDPHINELLYKQSGSFFEFLTQQKHGKDLMRQAIERSQERELTAAVLDVFGFENLLALETAWTTYALAKPGKMLTPCKLTLTETRDQLEQILTITIELVDPQTLETSTIITDFKGLARHKNRYRVNTIALEKQKQLQKLMLDSKPDYAPVIEAYVKCLNTIQQRDRKQVLRRFSRAEKLRKKLEKSSPYLNPERQQ